MHELRRGRLSVRRAVSAGEIVAAQRLRHQCFRGGPGLDADGFDAAAGHWLVKDDSGRLVACFRLTEIADAAALETCYSAQFFDLAPLAGLAFPMLELGRFCACPDRLDPDILRMAWGALAGEVDKTEARVLFGCTSFRGADPAAHAAALALLPQGHLAPAGRMPRARPAGAVALPADPPADPKTALAALPPLLRSYLGMGGWVADHAVPDPDLDTLIVFTAVEIAAIPPARARALRAIAAATDAAAA